MTLHRLIDFAVAAIGVVLVVTHFDGGFVSPPVLSGIALTLLGIRSFLR